MLARTSDPPEYQKAEALVRQGQWDQGIALLRDVLLADPANLKANNLMGIALTGKGDLVRANEQFRHALKVNPQFHPALKNLAINEFNLKETAAAERDFTAALKLAPNDPVTHTYLGEISYSRRDYKKASTHFSMAGLLRLKDPSLALHLAESYLETNEDERAASLLKQLDEQGLDPRLQFQAGVLLARHDMYSQAAPFFLAVANRFPDSYNGAFNLAFCYVQMKQYPAAINVLNRLRDRGRRTAELDNLLAEAFKGNKQVQEAINMLREATLLAPEDENNYLDLAALCSDHEAYGLAIETLNVGLHYLPNSDRLIFQRGAIRAMMGQLDLAEQDFELASTLAPEKNLAYVGLGITYMQKSNLPQALEVLRRRTREKPNDYVLQYLLGEVLLRSGLRPGEPSMAEAQQALEKSVALNPNFSRSRIDLGKVLLKLNRVENAITQLEAARELDPNDKSVYSQLAAAYRRKGDDARVAEMLGIVNKLNDQERQREMRNLVRIVRTDSP
jgi:tetratricopeptide (TPR) repeat protein